MGRCDYYIIGLGMTEAEARQDAMNTAEREYGHQEGYSGQINSSTGEDDRSRCLVKPKPAKTCNVEKYVQVGARKWETVFKIH